MDALVFLRSIDSSALSALDRARAILWFAGRVNPTIGMTSAQLCSLIETNGHPKQNISRLDTQLSRDTLVSRVPNSKAWRLHPRGRGELDKKYAAQINIPRQLDITDSVIMSSLFVGTRGYIEKVVRQINASYDVGLYDCCAVMCRRLLETLIIEVYESAGRANYIKGTDGNFLMLADLVKKITNDGAFNLGRSAKKGLEDFKRLGDLSAHNRRFNAQQNDIDQIRSGLRVSAEELLHLAAII